MPAISADLRERVLRAIQQGEPTSQIARRFEVSPAWVRRFHQRFRETGETTPRVPQSTRVPKLQPHLDAIRTLLAKTPDMALHELRHELAITVALSTLWLAVKQLGRTFKKVLFAAEQTRPDVAAARELWRQVIQPQFDVGRLVFVDETFANTQQTRRYGYASRGKPCVDSIPHGHYKSLTVTAALRADGLTAPCLLDGPMNGNRFVTFIQDCLGRVDSLWVS